MTCRDLPKSKPSFNANYSFFPLLDLTNAWGRFEQSVVRTAGDVNACKVANDMSKIL